MLSVRLSEDMEQKLESLTHNSPKTKSDIIKESLESYLQSIESTQSPYLLGVDLFGKHGSKQSNRSTQAEVIVRDKIRKKHGKHNH